MSLPPKMQILSKNAKSCQKMQILPKNVKSAKKYSDLYTSKKSETIYKSTKYYEITELKKVDKLQHTLCSLRGRNFELKLLVFFFLPETLFAMPT